LNYKSEIQKFITSQYIYSGARVALAIIIPSVILAYFGLLKEYFLFPLGTSFVGLTDMAGPFIRRRNSLILAIISFFTVISVASFIQGYPVLVFLGIVVFGMFFTLLGVYGQRLAAVGGLTLVVFSIFIDVHFSQTWEFKNIVTFIAGGIWFLLIFLLVSRLQPYKLASQMIGENYLELAEYLKIKAKFYQKNADLDALYQEVISKQIVIKNLQEETREMVFKTRTIVNEATTTSRLLMLMFLDAIDFYEKLMTSDQNYANLHAHFGKTPILPAIHRFLNDLAEEVTHIGIALQSGTKSHPSRDIDAELQKVYNIYFHLRKRKMSAETLENFMALRLILYRINEVADDVKIIHKVFSQDLRNIKSLSSGLDYDKFVPKQEQLNSRVLLNNLSLKSSHFRHAVRLTTALLIGYAVSLLGTSEIGHSYWILITIVAIMRPAYSTTKHRNLLRLYGTASGAVAAYLLLIFVENDTLLLGLLFTSMLLCFTLLKEKYATAVFFMTIYIFITFNFLNPGNVNLIFRDRILDTTIAGIIAAAVSYFILPVWEHTQNRKLMEKSTLANLRYFKNVIKKIEYKSPDDEEYRMRRKDAIISLANLSDSFQRLLSDPKNQQKKMESVHQFVTTSHLITAYTASLAQYSQSPHHFSEIDFENWERKILAELSHTLDLLTGRESQPDSERISIKTDDRVQQLLVKRKEEILEEEFFDRRDPSRISRLTELTSIQEILELLYDVALEQRRVTEKYAVIDGVHPSEES